MKRLLNLALLACCATAGFNANAVSYDATDAASQAPYHNGGHLHALWLKDFAPTRSWIFDGGPGSFASNGAGDFEFTGNVVNLGNASLTAMIDFVFTPAASGLPKKELTAGSYGVGPGLVDTSTWTYWDHISGNFSGTGILAGLELDITQRPDQGNNPNDIHGQLGVGANGKNANLGFSTWLGWKVVGCVDAFTGNNGCSPLNLDINQSGHGDINIDLTPVPLPAAFWLFGSAIFALVGLRRKSRLS